MGCSPSKTRQVVETVPPAAKKACLNPQLFPMYVVKMKDVLEMTEMLCHFDLIEQGKLHEYDESMGPALLASHQWLSQKHPDPDFKQVKILQEAVRNIISGEIHVENGIFQQVVANDIGRMPAHEVEKLLDVYVWMDWWSVPNGVHKGAPHAAPHGPHANSNVDKMKAIQSIPHYVERCTWFVALVPPLQIDSDESMLCDVVSWSQRGWCRVEQWCAWLGSAVSEHPKKMLICKGAKNVEILDPMKFLYNFPGLGQYTEEGDIPVLGKTFETMIDGVIAKKQQDKDMFWCNFFKAWRSSVLAGFPIEHKREETIEAFLAKYGLKSPTEKGPRGWTALHYAAVEADEIMCEQLVKAGADLEAKTTEAFKELTWLEGATPFFVASVFAQKSFAVLKKLYDLGADFGAVDANKLAPAHAATQSRNTETMKFLLDAGFDMETRDGFRNTVLLMAPLCGDFECVQMLLKAKVDLSVWDQFNAGVLHQCAVCDNAYTADAVSSLVKAGCNVNAQFEPETDEVKGFYEAILGMPDKGCALVKFVSFANDSQTPLAWAAFYDQPSLARQLLSNGADVTIKDKSGKTAVDWAEVRSPAVAAILAEHTKGGEEIPMVSCSCSLLGA